MVDFSSVGGVSPSQSRQNIERSSARLQTAIASLVSGERINRAADDVASLSIATQLQSEVSGLKTASGNIAQASSQVQVADSGAEQIGRALDRLNELAVQANSSVINDESRAALDQEFQSLVAEIDRLAEGTTFNGNALLNGDVSGDNALSITQLLGAPELGDDDALAIDSLTTEALFDGQSLNIQSQESASQAASVISAALDRATGTRAALGAFERSLNFAAANIDSAIANQEAARSVLQDTDFGEASTELSVANIQRNASIAIQAQGNNLAPNLLRLIG